MERRMNELQTKSLQFSYSFRQLSTHYPHYCCTGYQILKLCSSLLSEEFSCSVLYPTRWVITINPSSLHSSPLNYLRPDPSIQLNEAYSIKAMNPMYPVSPFIRISIQIQYGMIGSGSIMETIRDLYSTGTLLLRTNYKNDQLLNRNNYHNE